MKFYKPSFTNILRLLYLAHRIKRDPKLLLIKSELALERFELDALLKKHKKASKGITKFLRPSYYYIDTLEEDIADQKEIFKSVENEYVEFYKKRASNRIKRKAIFFYNQIPTYIFNCALLVTCIVYLAASIFKSPANTTVYLTNAGCIFFFASLLLVKPKDY